jgi:hypothetical protein
MRPGDLTYFLSQMSKQLPAKTKSVHSDLLMPRLAGEMFWGAYNAICVLVGLCCTGLNPIQEEFVRNHFYRKALERKEKGSWKIVSTLCTTTPWTPYYLVQVIFDTYDPCEIYGNLIPQIAKCLNKIKWINPYLQDIRPVKKTQRKRGYTDKGSLGSSVEAPGLESYVSPTDLRSESTTFADAIPQGRVANTIEDSRIRARELLLIQNETDREKRREIEEELYEIIELPEDEGDPEELICEEVQNSTKMTRMDLTTSSQHR